MAINSPINNIINLKPIPLPILIFANPATKGLAVEPITPVPAPSRITATAVILS